MFYSTLSYSQCSWKKLFPFKIGDDKFEISKKKSLNPTIIDSKNPYIAFSKFERYKVKYDYMKDSAQINLIRLEYHNNKCFDNGEIVLFLVNNKLYKAEISIRFNTYSEMIKKYNYILKIVPKRYVYAYDNTITDSNTKEKIGEGIIFCENNYKNDEKDKIWNDYLSVSYTFNYERKFDEEKKKVYFTNNIEDYELQIKIVDLRNVVLNRFGY